MTRGDKLQISLQIVTLFDILSRTNSPPGILQHFCYCTDHVNAIAGHIPFACFWESFKYRNSNLCRCGLPECPFEMIDKVKPKADAALVLLTPYLNGLAKEFQVHGAEDLYGVLSSINGVTKYYLRTYVLKSVLGLQ